MLSMCQTLHGLACMAYMGSAWVLSHSVVSSSLRSHGLWPIRLLCPWNWSGLPFPTPGDLPDPGIKPMSLVSPLAGRFFTTRPPGKPSDTGLSAFKCNFLWFSQPPSPGRFCCFSHFINEGFILKGEAIYLPETWLWQLADLEFEFPSPHSVPSSIWHQTVACLTIEDPVLCSAGLTGVPLAWRGTAFLLLTYLSYDFSAFCTWLTLIPILAHTSCPRTPPHYPLFILGVLFRPVGCKWTRNYLSWNPASSVFYNPWSPSHFIVVSTVLLSKRSLVKFWWKSFAWIRL